MKPQVQQTTISTTGVPIGPTGTQYAGFWIRVAAALIDGVILFVPNMVITTLTTPQMGAMHTGASTLGQLVILAMYIGYFTYFHGGKWQATPGKRLVGVHVLRADGARLTYARACGRYFAAILSGLILLIGYIMVAFTNEKTALHDLIADTRVVYGKR